MATIAADIAAAINVYHTSSSSSRIKQNLGEAGNGDDFDRLGLANSCIISALQSEERLAVGEEFLGRRGRTGNSSSSTTVSTPIATSSTGVGEPSSTSTIPTITSSILDDHGYTVAGTVEDDSEVLLSSKQTIPTPPLLLSEISSKAHVSTLMGIFPSANLAWLTVDSTCYIWSYSTSSSSVSTTDFCSFTVPSNQCITSVGLATPKEGIFKAQVLWILVIATPEEVLLCAITTANTTAVDAQTTTVFGPNLRIIPTTFCLPTDGCSIYLIQGTSQGRIFLGTSNGNVLEFCYQIDLMKQTQEQIQRLKEEEEEETGEMSGDEDDYEAPTISWTSTILSGSKRLLSDFLFSTSTTSRNNRTLQEQQPRKKQCCKVNHTQPSFFATLLPNFLHSLFFISSNSRGGDGSPILDMVVIEGEQNYHHTQVNDIQTTSPITWLHVLNANGILYTYSLLPNTTELHFILSEPINIPRVTQHYLEALTRPISQNDYYSYSSTASNTSASFHFAAGVPVALAGLGGTTVECAKRILKYCTNTSAKREHGVTKGILHPLRIYGVPPYMSSRVGLVIVTQGGFRLYLSISDNCGNNKNISTSTSKVNIQMCHIRAPPSSYTSSSLSSSKVNPGVLHHHHNLQQQQQLASAVASYYDFMNQTLLLGLDGYAGLLDYSNFDEVVAADDQYTGDILVACVPDLRRPKVVEPQATTTRVSTTSHANITTTGLQLLYGSGSKEIVAAPKGSTEFGRIWQITGLTDDCFIRTYLTGSISPSGGNSGTPMSSYVHLPACPSVVLLKHKKKYKVLQFPSKHKGEENFISSPSVNAAIQNLVTTTTSTMAAPLPLLTLQFYRFLFGKDDEILTLTTSGVHVFKVSSTLELLCRGLSSPTMSDNKIIQKFLPDFGASELCFMCLTIAIAPSSSQNLIQRAKRIALANGGRPTVLLEGQEDGGQTFYETSATVTLMPQQPQQSTTFRPSALHQGFVSLLARLLRPVWFQPFLHVIAPIASKKLHKRESKRRKPHHVYILFDPNLVLLELKGLQNLMKDMFARAIESVPVSSSSRRGSQLLDRTAPGTTMDVDEWTFTSPPSRPNLMLAAAGVRFQQPTSSQFLVQDENSNVAARYYEETSLHNLYRLLSRTTQALTLLSILLRRQKEEDDDALLTAENAPVEWGFLHNLSLHQIVCSPEATDRITALLQSMLLSSSSSPFSITNPSNGAYYYNAEGSNANSRIAFRNHQLAQELSSQCYHYFLQSDYMSQEAMAAIIAARNEIPGSETFRVLSHRAAILWTKASVFWRSARLVTGKLAIQHPSVTASGIKEEPSVILNFPDDLDSLAYSSVYSSSPLVKACVALFSISNVTGIVDVCLTCATNFGGTASGTEGESIVESKYMIFQPQTVKAANSMPFPWEEGLYCSITSTASRLDSSITGIAAGSMYSPKASERLALLRSLSPAAARASTPSSAASTAATSNFIGSSSLVYSEIEDVASPLFARQFCCSLILHFLHLLFLGKMQQVSGATFLNGTTHDGQTSKIAELMLSVCVASNDEYFHTMLYEFLLISDNVSTLLRLQTPFLETWLAKIKRTAAVEDGTQLLYRYYVVHHRHDLASTVMEQKASIETENIPLENRIECLMRAISSASAAVNDINGGDRSLEVMRLSELKDKLEVALLQKKILLKLGGLDDETRLDPGQKQSLQYKLLTVSELFNDFAAPLGLYDICLLIMSVCKTNDSRTIQDIWNRIFSSVLHKVWSTREEVQRVLRAIHDEIFEEGPVEFESGEWIRPLKEKVIYLGKQLWGKGSDYTFPLLLIIPILEDLRQTFLEVSDGGRMQSLILLESLHWPMLSLAQSGVSYPIILDCYRMILSDKEKEGDLDGRCISEILTQWIKASYSARAKALDVYHGGDAKTTEMTSITNNLAAQLTLARSTGLLNLIDNYKSSLEAVVGRRSREAIQLLKVYIDIEENLKAF